MEMQFFFQPIQRSTIIEHNSPSRQCSYPATAAMLRFVRSMSEMQ